MRAFRSFAGASKFVSLGANALFIIAAVLYIFLYKKQKK